jgi:hydroxyethylthiazole kinase-like sugar kinase family protein
MAPTSLAVPRIALLAGVALSALLAASCANGQSETDAVPAAARAYANAAELAALPARPTSPASAR